VGRLGVAGWECRVTSAGAFPMSLVRAARMRMACGHRQGLIHVACGCTATPGGSRGFATLPEDVQRRVSAPPSDLIRTSCQPQH
jgi:hypothetical protein